jgi:alpha-L-rhamnosidase
VYAEWVWRYWLHTGDRVLLGEVYPVLVKLSEYVNRAVDPSTGLVTRLQTSAASYPYPVATRVNILGANVFRRSADAALALGRPSSEVARQRGRQATLTSAINRQLTRSDGVYVDGLVGRSRATRASQEVNACAVVYGVTPARSFRAVVGHVTGLGMQAEPQTAAEVIRCLAMAGDYTTLLARLTDPSTNGWANILARGGTFTWEVWQPSDANGDSMSHGWGSNVLVEIQHALLGVTPTAPGYATFDVTRPQAGLASASGRVPTPRGFISVAWHGESSTATALTLTVPANANATVHLRTTARITVNGQPAGHGAGVGPLRPGPDGTIFTVGAGTYRIHAA